MGLTFKTNLFFVLIFFYSSFIYQSISSSSSIVNPKFHKRTSIHEAMILKREDKSNLTGPNQNLTTGNGLDSNFTGSGGTTQDGNDYQNLNDDQNLTQSDNGNSNLTDGNDTKSNHTSIPNSINFPGEEGKPECESGGEKLIEHDCNRALLALGTGIAGKIKFLRVSNDTATGTFKTCKVTVQSLDGKPVHVSKGRLEHGPGYVDFMKICKGQPGTMILGGGEFGMTIESSECDGQ
ncbi:uncharacterized protein MELLADRAFT_65016 [Melampsora larici-populina 98AG31]|uniref:Secreted protein n=1 Tax=Melampsora larici-populina (strain 98AG31 / pathotype 3-4-7) TaxID=747676 RepID=F4RTP0_MELLP|nr:uncharacterized protein MELLADRAFT_65016 [Melampsora larici-populina 98AG31]EGG04306.1 hypothetical protein MELLADRAFT_65016 [Melampsora larici-populina 98AG31]